jgi:hypothetical protein
MCHFIDGREYIVHSRDDLNKQMTAMRSRFRNYHSYANATFQEAMRKDEIEKAFVLKAVRFENSYIENVGGGRFKMHTLPLEAQFSPVFGMITQDFNGDGNLDVLCVGNSFSTEVQTGRYDAQGSMLLIGNGKGEFNVDRRSLNIGGDNKSVAQIQLANGMRSVLVGTNADSLRVFDEHSKMISVKLWPDDAYAMVVDKNGKGYREEFYYGHSYLSQGTRTLFLPEGTERIEIYSYTNKRRTIKL